MKKVEQANYDEQFDTVEHLMDTQGLSVADAHARAGLDFQPDYEMFQAERVQARNDAHDLHVNLYHVPEDPRQANLSPEQQASIEQSKRAARKAIGRTALEG